MTLLIFDFTFVNNTVEQCTLRNKQITVGNATFSPEGDQVIGSQGGQVLMTVTANSTDDTSFTGTFEIQFAAANFECSFSFTSGQGATFDAKPNEAGGIKLEYDPPIVDGSTASLSMNIIPS